MFGLGFLSLKNLPYIIAGLLIVALGVGFAVQSVRVANRDSTISEKDTTIAKWVSNCTAQETEIGLLQEDQRTTKVSIEALQTQLDGKEEAIQQYREDLAAQQALVGSLTTTPAAPKQQKGEVLDDESSARVIRFINTLLGRVGVWADEPAADSAHRGASEVHAVQPAQ